MVQCEKVYIDLFPFGFSWVRFLIPRFGTAGSNTCIWVPTPHWCDYPQKKILIEIFFIIIILISLFSLHHIFILFFPSIRNLILDLLELLLSVSNCVWMCVFFVQYYKVAEVMIIHKAVFKNKVNKKNKIKI